MFALNLSLDIQGGRHSVPINDISGTQPETMVDVCCGTMSNIMLSRNYIDIQDLLIEPTINLASHLSLLAQMMMLQIF